MATESTARMTRDQAIAFLTANPGRSVEFTTRDATRSCYVSHLCRLDADGDLVYAIHPTDPQRPGPDAPKGVIYQAVEPSTEATMESIRSALTAADIDWKHERDDTLTAEVGGDHMTIYWDSQDPQSTGFAYRIRCEHGGEESGEINDVADIDNLIELLTGDDDE